PNNPACAEKREPDVMGYHVATDIPNYWTYARDFVLQDHMFEPTSSWSLPAHLFTVSEWSAQCANARPSSCVNNDSHPGPSPWRLRGPGAIRPGAPGAPRFAWTDLTYLLHAQRVTWGYYVVPGAEPDCRDDDTMSCAAVPQRARTPGIWNPLPYFETVK